MSADHGHVFVVLGDLSLLACDDVLVPTDAQRHVTSGWWRLVPDELLGPEGPYGRPVRVDGSVERGVLRLPVDGLPRRWLVDTATADPDALAAAVRRFAEAVGSASAPPRHDRARRLVGLPLVGTGEGGAGGNRGDVIARLFPVLQETVERTGMDVALVLRDPRDHSAVQEVRRRSDLPWALPDELCRQADELAAIARAGELALFVGAGVSRAAGLPMWTELLHQLAVTTGTDDADVLSHLPPPDAAQLLYNRLGPERFAAEIRARFDRREHALAHALLAALPVTQTVTTNYDPLLESAAVGAGRRLRILPSADRGPVEPWLVKLHGDARRPEDVVLTRASFLRLPEEQAALTGVVQALLLTRHVLFVGFSLLDDTFIRIAHEVRRLLQRAAGSPGERGRSRVGTALALVDEPVRRELWADDLDFVAVAPPGSDFAAAARVLEIFLDRLAASATTRTGWLLDDRYAALRTDDDAALAAALGRLVRDAEGPARRSLGWPLVEQGLRSLGLHPEP